MPTCTRTWRFISVLLCSGQSESLLFVFLSNLIINLIHNIKKLYFNPITYGILTFRQLRGGLFGPDPENKVTVNGLI